jgi:hypothetical protein
MHYSLMGKMRLPFIDSDLLYIEMPFKAGLTVVGKIIIRGMP